MPLVWAESPDLEKPDLGNVQEILVFTPLGPPTLEELDKLFPSGKKQKTSVPEEKKAKPVERKDDASDLLMQMIQSPDPAVRLRAVEGLGSEGNEDACPLLFIALADQEAMVRDAAIKALLVVPQDALLESIVGALGWGDPVIAQAVDASLPNLRSALDAPMLGRFTNPEAPRVERMVAAYCLGRMGSVRGAESLADEVWDDDLALALYCAEALASIEDPALLRQYVRMAQHPQVQVRTAAYRGLARIGGDDARAVLLPAARGATEPDSNARKFAIRQLASVPNEEVVEYLIDLIRADAGLVRPSSDALAAILGLPQGLHRGHWLDWYNEYYLPAKQAREKPESARANTDADAGVPVGFPEGGFPFIP
ncbi:MAG: HEAT repeat domain-containing protein [Candidatus Hydrogenedentes bacterium]|nr:HEAT repeat domain-containing protein [Candidatus Hydrogenedentota bacterium]